MFTSRYYTIQALIVFTGLFGTLAWEMAALGPSDHRSLLNGIEAVCQPLDVIGQGIGIPEPAVRFVDLALEIGEPLIVTEPDAA